MTRAAFLDIVRILCESKFCHILATFKTPQVGTSLVEALSEHFRSNRHLQTNDDELDSRFHLGTMQEIAARPRCRFCRFVVSATNIDS